MSKVNVPVIIDVEASGFGSHSYPIEVDIAFDDGRKSCSLISPAPNWIHWNDEAEKVHQISRDILKENGKIVYVLADELNEMLDGLTLYFDDWVVDKPWLVRLYEAAGRQMKFYVSPLEMILSAKQMAIWHKVKDKVVLEMNLARHRASFYASIIQETFKQSLE